MAGQNVVVGAQPVEYIEESSFATLEADGAYSWFGIIDSWSAEQGVESESITYLPEYGASNKLDKRVNVKLREMYSADVTYHPQNNFDFLKYFTGTIGGTSDEIPSIQVGEVNESISPEEFRRLMGGIGEEVTLSVEEDGVAEVEGSFVFADAEDWTDTDYIGNGSHASEKTTEPFSYDDLSSVQYGGTNMSGMIESVELSISNEIAEVRDPNVSRNTQIAALVPVDREITVDVEFTYENWDILSDVRSYTKKDFTFDIGTTTFTVTDVAFPEVPYEYTADDLVSDSLTSDPASGVTWS
jgi:hypothetical protein